MDSARVRRKGTSVSHCHYLIGIGIKHFVTVQAQSEAGIGYECSFVSTAREQIHHHPALVLTTRSRGSIHTMKRASSVLMLISQLLELTSLGIFKHPIKLTKKLLGWFKTTEKPI